MKNQKGVSMITLIITIIVIIILAAIAFVAAGDTAGNAQFSGFEQEFGDFQLGFKTDSLADTEIKYRTNRLLSDEQIIWLASDSERQKAYDTNYSDATNPKDILANINVPAGKTFPKLATVYTESGKPDTVTFAADVACYDLDADVIEGYTRGQFYGDNYGKETYHVTEDGVVFTLPGYPRTVDGENRFYVTPTLHYKADTTGENEKAWGNAILAIDSEIENATGEVARSADSTLTPTVEGDKDLMEAIENKK